MEPFTICGLLTGADRVNHEWDSLSEVRYLVKLILALAAIRGRYALLRSSSNRTLSTTFQTTGGKARSGVNGAVHSG
jgi:hypothetical protein